MPKNVVEEKSSGTFEATMEDQDRIPEVTETLSVDYRSDAGRFSRNGVRLPKVNDIEDTRTRTVLELAVARSKLYREREESECQPTKECQLEKPQQFYYTKMKQFADKLPPNILLPEWEDNIRNLISSDLRYKYADIFENQMQETKTRYYEAMHDLAVKRVIAIECQDVCNIELGRILPYKLAGRTEFYPKYLKNRCAIRKQYYLPHRLMRSIVARAHILMPTWICDFARYRFVLDYLDFNRFLDLVENDTKKGALAIGSTYYGDIVRLISQPRYVHDVPPLSLPDFLRCANNLLALQVVTRMIDTIEYLLLILKNQRTVPLFKLQLKCEEDDLFLSPTMREICNAFHAIVDQISHVGQQLPPLDSWVGAKIEQEYIKVALPEWYLEETHRRLEEILQNTFQPFIDYVGQLYDKFKVVFNPETRKNVAVYIRTGRSFQECVSKVEDFNGFVREINGMPDHEYFSIGVIHQVAAKAGLLDYTEQMRKLIIGELVRSHRNYNLEICNTFESIRERASNVPHTTKELLELGEYMLHAASTIMRSLEEKITLSLRMMASLIGMTSLTKDHIELNNTTIHWLKRIRPIFEQNSATYEQIKFELEEKLQRKVEQLNADVESMFPRYDTLRIPSFTENVEEFWDTYRSLCFNPLHPSGDSKSPK